MGKKTGPVSSASEIGADRKSLDGDKRPQAFNGDLSSALSIYEGRIHVGWVRPNGEHFEAITAERISLGSYDSSGAAQSAAWAEHERRLHHGSHV